MGSEKENLPEKASLLEKRIAGLHRRAISYLSEYGQLICTMDQDLADDYRSDSVINWSLFRVIDKNGKITEKKYTVQTGVFKCAYEDENEVCVPDDVPIYFGFDEEAFLRVTPDKAIIVRDGKKLRDAEEKDLNFHGTFAVSIVTLPSSMSPFYPTDSSGYCDPILSN